MKKVNNLGVLLILFSSFLSAENCNESDETNIIIEDGNIAEEGTHDNLLAKKGRYYKLHKYQARI